MPVLAGHGPKASHLPHQPLQHAVTPAHISGYEAARFFSQVLQNGAAFKNRQWRAAAYRGVVNDGGHAVVRADGEEVGLKLFALADVDRHHVVRQAAFLKHDGNLPSVGRWPVMQVNHVFSSLQLLGVMPQVVVHEAGDEVVAVVIAFMPAQGQRLALRGACRFK